MEKNTNNRVHSYLAAAGSHGRIPEHHMPEKKRRDYDANMRMKGALRLKRTLLGLCGKEVEKTLEELAEALVRSGVIEQEKQVHALLLHGLLDHPLMYGHRLGKRMDLVISETADRKYKCHVQKHQKYGRATRI